MHYSFREEQAGGKANRILGWASCGLMKTKAGFLSGLTDFSHNQVGSIHPLTEIQAPLNKWCPSLHILLQNID